MRRWTLRTIEEEAEQPKTKTNRLRKGEENTNKTLDGMGKIRNLEEKRTYL